MNRDDVRMLQRSHHTRLTTETLARRAAPRQFGEQHLDRHRPLQAMLPGPVDDTAASTGDDVPQLVGSQPRAAVRLCGGQGGYGGQVPIGGRVRQTVAHHRVDTELALQALFPNREACQKFLGRRTAIQFLAHRKFGVNQIDGVVLPGGQQRILREVTLGPNVLTTAQSALQIRTSGTQLLFQDRVGEMLRHEPHFPRLG